MKLIALIGSPRKGSNTDILVDQFLEGAQTNGHTSGKRYLYKYEISPCYERKEILNNKEELQKAYDLGASM